MYRYLLSDSSCYTSSRRTESLYVRQLLHLILFEWHYTKRDKTPRFFVPARCSRTTSESYNVVTAGHARCTYTCAVVHPLYGSQVITLQARHRGLHVAVPISVCAAIFGPDVLSTNPSVIYYSPVIDQPESPWHPCKTRSRNMETLVATMTNYFGTKRLRFTVNCIRLIKIYNE